MLLKKFALGLTATTVLGLGTAALAASPEQSVDNSGFYARAQAGYGWESYKSEVLARLSNGTTININNDDSDGFAGRVSGGYNFNQYVGLEAGFALYNDMNRNLVADPITGGKITAKSSIYSIDTMAKVTVPLQKFFVFAEAGAAYVHVKQKAGEIADGVTIEEQNHGNIMPRLGAGVGYNLTNHMALDVSYDRIFGKNDITNDNYVPTINTTMVGFTYKF